MGEIPLKGLSSLSFLQCQINEINLDKHWEKLGERFDAYPRLTKLGLKTMNTTKTTGVGWCWSHVWALFDNTLCLELIGGVSERDNKNSFPKLEKQVFCRSALLFYHFINVLNSSLKLYSADSWSLSWLEFKRCTFHHSNKNGINKWPNNPRSLCLLKK